MDNKKIKAKPKQQEVVDTEFASELQFTTAGNEITHSINEMYSQIGPRNQDEEK